MFSLWVFGIIIEGKVGPFKFLAIYHAIGIVKCAIEQTLMFPFGEDGASWGATSIIYGLMAIAMIWAPANNIQCQYAGFGRFAMSDGFDVTVYFFVGLSLIFEFFGVALRLAFANALDMSMFAVFVSEVLHLMGAGFGAGIGLFMLKAGLVDCEGWDVFSVWQGKHTRSKEQIAEEYLNSEEGKAKVQAGKDDITNLIRQYLANDGTAAAWAAYKRGLNQFPGFQLPETDLLALIGGLRKAGMWDETISLMVVFLRQYPQRDAAVRLALAQIMMEKKSRGLQALKVLQKIDKRKLDPRHLPTYEQFATRAQAMANDDPYEVAAEDW